jgi:hypothetical protein
LDLKKASYSEEDFEMVHHLLGCLDLEKKASYSELDFEMVRQWLDLKKASY